MSTNGTQISVVGNITRDPELRFTNSGRAVASFGLAVNRRYMVDNEWREETSFFDCSAWGETAERTVECFKKGDRVIVLGRLDQRTWENEQGEKRSKFELTADEIGASIRWATVQVTKAQRSDGTTRSRPAPQEDYEEEQF